MSSRAALVGVVCSLAAFGLLAAGVVSGATLHADLTIRAMVHSWESPALTAVMAFITHWGSPRADAVVVLISCVVLLIKRHPEGAIWLACALVGAGLLRYVLALTFHRERPLPFFAPELSSYSFPSGHAVFATCVYAVLAGVLTAPMKGRTRGRISRFAVRAVALLWILAIGFSRIYLGFHYPSDVLAGYAVGSAWVSALVLGRQWLPFWPVESAARHMPIGS